MLETSRSRAASSSTSRTSVPAWPQSSSSACSEYAERTMSPSACHNGSPVRAGSAFGPP